jgi:hypothetical protein
MSATVDAKLAEIDAKAKQAGDEADVGALEEVEDISQAEIELRNGDARCEVYRDALATALAELWRHKLDTQTLEAHYLQAHGYWGKCKFEEEAERLRAVLEQIRELIDGYVDVNDGPDGQSVPNKAMQAQTVITIALAAAARPPEESAR